MDPSPSVNPMDDVHLFISHKKEDQECAEEIRNTLIGRSGRLKVHIFEDAPAGSHIEEWIKEHLSHSEILLFRYNDSSANWNWCFVEIGKYTELPAPRNVICICSESISWPTPLQSIQNVRAEPREVVSKFLDPLYRSAKFYEPKAPLNESITDDQLYRIAEKIVMLMEPKEIKPYYYSERFLLRIEDIEKARTNGIPDEARIQVHGERSEIFDLHTSSFDWRTLMSRVAGGEGSAWATEQGG
jgi:TIR domain